MNIYEIGSVRTNNLAADMGEKIGGLWQQVVAEIGPTAPIYGVYHDYETNYLGDYTLSLAVESSETGRKIILDEGNYQIFPVELTPDDPSRNNVAETWQRIWALEQAGNLHRRYEKDYEKYEQDGSVAIYISIE